MFQYGIVCVKYSNKKGIPEFGGSSFVLTVQAIPNDFK